MEDILVLILQAVIEIALELLGAADWVPLDVGGKSGEEDGCIGLSFLSLIFGAACGGILTLLHSKVLLPFAWLRVANLIVGPLVSGGISYAIAAHRKKANAAINPWNRFWYGLCYTQAFVAVRFAYGAR